MPLTAAETCPSRHRGTEVTWNAGCEKRRHPPTGRAGQPWGPEESPSPSPLGAGQLNPPHASPPPPAVRGRPPKLPRTSSPTDGSWRKTRGIQAKPSETASSKAVNTRVSYGTT